MSHQPPLPAAAQSPFPLHPTPIQHPVKPAVTPAPRAKAPSVGTGTLLGIGAAVAAGSLALAAAFLRRRAKPATKPTRRSADRKRIASTQQYEVAYFARKHGLTSTEARDVIKEAGQSRSAANALANKRKAAGAS